MLNFRFDILSIFLLTISLGASAQEYKMLNRFHMRWDGTKAYSTAYMDYMQVMRPYHGCREDTTLFEDRYRSHAYWGTQRVVPFPNNPKCAYGLTGDDGLTLTAAEEFSYSISKDFVEPAFKVKKVRVENLENSLTVRLKARRMNNSRMRNMQSRVLNGLAGMEYWLVESAYSHEQLKGIFDTLISVDSKLYDRGGGVVTMEFKTRTGFFRINVRPINADVRLWYGALEYDMEEQAKFVEAKMDKYNKDRIRTANDFDRNIIQKWKDQQKDYRKLVMDRYKLLRKEKFSPTEKEMSRAEWISYAGAIWRNETECLLRSDVRHDVLLRYLDLTGLRMVQTVIPGYTGVQGLVVDSKLGSPEYSYCIDLENERMLPLNSTDDWQQTVQVPQKGDFMILAILADGKVAVTSRLNAQRFLGNPIRQMPFEILDADLMTIEALMRWTGMDKWSTRSSVELSGE